MPRHTAIVRVTHWVTAIGTVALIVSGVAILLAHPRLYWGETGAVGTPALIDLPIPSLLGHSGWGRYLHFLAAWVCVASGAAYLVYGLTSRHFSRNLVPTRADLAPANVARVVSDHLRLNLSSDSTRSYNILQRVAYLAVIFLVGPLLVLSGLAFSPALASVAPVVVDMFGGQQSARTVHFFVGLAVVLFLVLHVVMVWLTGFRTRMRMMITGNADSAAEHA